MSLLILNFKDLTEISKTHVNAIQAAVEYAVQKNQTLYVSINSKEIKQPIDLIWSNLQQFLSTLYVIQLTTSYRLNSPLFDCLFLFQDLCGYTIPTAPFIHTLLTLPYDTYDLDTWQTIRQIPLNKNSLSISLDPTSFSTLPSPSSFIPHTFQKVAVGGTFDHLHAGHKILLTMTALLAHQTMIAGVTDDSMLTQKKLKDWIGPVQERTSQVKELLKKIKVGLVYEVVPIQDPFGPTITDPEIDAIVVSRETIKGGHLINDERKKRGFSSLEIRVIDVISAENTCIDEKDMAALKISSSWIREYLANQSQPSA